MANSHASLIFPVNKAHDPGELAIPEGPSHTDGQPRYWPSKARYSPAPVQHHLNVLGMAWAKTRGLTVPGVYYHLNKLPDGYALFEANAPSQAYRYKRLFGHPSGRYYDSAIRFQPHFLWLMDGMPEGKCECVLCGGKKPAPTRGDFSILAAGIGSLKTGGTRKAREGVWGELPSTAFYTVSDSDREQRPRRRLDPLVAVDEEGNEDVYKFWIKKLREWKNPKYSMSEEIEEKNSLDWRAEHKQHDPLLTAHFSRIALQHSFIPRAGELVLWCNYMPEGLDLLFNPEKGTYELYSFDLQRFLGFPEWRGGVIASVPSFAVDEAPVDFTDILTDPEKKYSVNTSGFRVETFPNPNNDTDKSLSKQYKYVPLRQIRPVGHWQNLLRGIPERKLHPSIKYALTAMTTVSLVEKWNFTGDWPNASIHCKGMYLGSELIALGDAVRIVPSPSSTEPHAIGQKSILDPPCTDVLVVSSIRLNLHEITEEHTLPGSPLLSTRSSITLLGKAYTLDPRKDYRLLATWGNNSSQTLQGFDPIPLDDVKHIFPIIGAKDYGDWFPLHPDSKKYEISFDRVLGRLYEGGAMRLWTGLSQLKQTNGGPKKPSLNYDLGGILAGRRYATSTDERIPKMEDGGIRWFWADTRVQALSLETLNGEEVGVYDEIRTQDTLRSWRAILRIIDGQYSQEDARTSGLPQRKGRQKGTKIVDGKVVFVGDDYGGNVMRRPSSTVGKTGSSQISKHGGSQMVGAAMESDTSEDKDEDVLQRFLPGSSSDPSRKASPSRDRNGKGKAPLSKAAIMESAELPSEDDDGMGENYNDDDELIDELTRPPPVRGGTEESEGGDYRPEAGHEVSQDLLMRFQAGRRDSNPRSEKRPKF